MTKTDLIFGERGQARVVITLGYITGVLAGVFVTTVGWFPALLLLLAAFGMVALGTFKEHSDFLKKKETEQDEGTD